jgi:hypothetical protein
MGRAMSRWQDAYAQGLRKRAADLRAVGDSLAAKIEWKAEVDEARLDNQVAKEAKPEEVPILDTNANWKKIATGESLEIDGKKLSDRLEK